MPWLTVILQILGGIGGIGAVLMAVRSLYFLRVDRQEKGVNLSATQQQTALAFMAAQSPEVERLTKRLKDQDEYISDLETRLIETRRALVELQLFADSMKAKYEMVDSQLSAAQIELRELRSREQ